MCHNQVVESTDYASFNVVGLCVILFVGAMVIVLSMFDERLCRWLLPKNELNEYRHSSWEKTELLELQAAAFQKNESEVSSGAVSFDDSEESKTPHSTARISEL